MERRYGPSAIFPTIDALDEKILKVLAQNLFTNYEEIARLGGCSKMTAHNRVTRLEDRGIIKEYTIVVDPMKLGYHETAIIHVEYSEGFSEIVGEISKLRQVCGVYSCLSPYSNIEVITRGKNIDDIQKIVDAIREVAGVKETKLHRIAKTSKEDFTLTTGNEV